MKRLLRIILAIPVVLIAAVILIGCARLAYRGWIGSIDRKAYEKRIQSNPSRPAARFYVSVSGNDAASGTSPEQAWRTVSKINSVDFVRGDSILFAGGEQFEGNLRFDMNDVGTPAKPILVSSYGTGRATIQAAAGDGILVNNTGGFRIENLNLVGSGSQSNRGDGIAFQNDLLGDIRIDFIRIDQVEVSGFGKHGIRVAGTTGKSGYRDVRITNVVAHDNAVAGIYVLGRPAFFSSQHAHENVYIGYCRSFHNSGIPGREIQHTGSGIVLSDVAGGLIEHSTAYNNGWLCESNQGGPVGIWAWDGEHVTIQYSESYANKTSGIHDGGGFDLDGGMTDSVMQYNYSHDNDGAGYMLCQYEYSRPTYGNTVRYNISHNDGRRNGMGGLTFWGGIGKSEIYNNTVYMTRPEHGDPSPVLVDEEASIQTSFLSNILVSSGGLSVIKVKPGQKALFFQDNDYYSVGAPLQFDWYGRKYAGLDAWRAATGQERVNNSAMGRSVDPGLVGPGADGAGSYKLRKDSPLIDAGMDLTKMFGIDRGNRDFYGASIPHGARYDVGAHEYSESAP